MLVIDNKEEQKKALYEYCKASKECYKDYKRKLKRKIIIFLVIYFSLVLFLNKIDEKFDIVVSSLAIHYIEDYDGLCKRVYNLLVDGGRFIFSYGHSMDSCAILDDYSNNYMIINNKKYFLISDYNNEGKRISH